MSRREAATAAELEGVLPRGPYKPDGLAIYFSGPWAATLTRLMPVERGGEARAGDRSARRTVAVALPVRQVVPQVDAVRAHRLPVGQHAHVVPHHLFVAERRPAVRAALLLEVLERAASRGHKQRPASDRVVERRLTSAVHLAQKFCGHKVAGVLSGREQPVRPAARPAHLCVVSVVAADAVGELRVAAPAQVRLDARRRSPVRFRRHDSLAAWERQLRARLKRGALAAVREAVRHGGVASHAAESGGAAAQAESEGGSGGLHERVHAEKSEAQVSEREHARCNSREQAARLARAREITFPDDERRVDRPTWCRATLSRPQSLMSVCGARAPALPGRRAGRAAFRCSAASEKTGGKERIYVGKVST